MWSKHDAEKGKSVHLCVCVCVKEIERELTHSILVSFWQSGITLAKAMATLSPQLFHPSLQTETHTQLYEQPPLLRTQRIHASVPHNTVCLHQR